MLINQVKWKWDEKGYRQSSLCDKGPEPKKAIFVKENRYTEDCIMYIHKISERFHKELVMLITSQKDSRK